ncbi:Uncharacterised protein [Shigella sonnei]|nr:Uncharacterised protein [Shigella sonnei]
MTLAPLQQQIISLCRWVTFPVRAEIGKQAFPLAAVQTLCTLVIPGIFAFWFFRLPLFGYRNEFRHTCLHRAVPAQQFAM